MLLTCCCGEALEHMDMTSSMSAYRDMLEGEGSLALIITLAVLLITTLVYFISRSFQTQRRVIAVVGDSGAGKTLMFTQLVAGVGRETLTSLKPNQAPYTSTNNNGKPNQFTMVDIPGSESLREKHLDKIKDNIRAILFVVDSETAGKNIKDVAIYLYRLLTDEVFNKTLPTILIACNKQDLLLSKSKRVIQGLLENELNTVRRTQSALLSTTAATGDAAATASPLLGKKNENFQFSHLKFNVEFCECKSKCADVDEGSEVDLTQVKKWLQTV